MFAILNNMNVNLVKLNKTTTLNQNLSGHTVKRRAFTVLSSITALFFRAELGYENAICNAAL